MKVAGKNEIAAASAGMLGLASRGISWTEFVGALGLDPAGLAEVAEMMADEPFAVMSGLPGGAPASGSLVDAGLTEEQEQLVKAEIREGFSFALASGAVLERSRIYDPDQLGAFKADVQAAQQAASNLEEFLPVDEEAEAIGSQLNALLNRIREYADQVGVPDA